MERLARYGRAGRLRRGATLTAVLVAALAVVGCGSAKPLPAAPAGAVHLRLFGFNDNAVAQGLVSPAQDAKLARGAGANALRTTLDWRLVERLPGVYDFHLYDAINAALTARGLRPVWILLFAPAWSRPGACPVTLPACAAPPDAAHDGAWRKFVSAVARRYPHSAGIEIWNEPNYVTFWYPRPDPNRYAQLLAQAYTAVKQTTRSIPVVAGGFGDKPVDPTSGDVDLATFTRAVFAAGGGRSMDALGLHPYPLGTDETAALASLASVRAIRDAFGFAHMPLWATETGVSTTAPAPLGVSPDQQARELVDLYRRIGAMTDVQALFIHTMLEPPGSAPDPEVGYGVLHVNGAPKPAFAALRAAVGHAPPRW